MAIPFIIAGIAAIAGAYGAKKGIDGYRDTKEANNVNNKAKEIYDTAANKLDSSRKTTDADIKKLGDLKIQIYEESLTEFTNLLKYLKNIRELEYDLNFESRNLDENFNFEALQTKIFEITNIITTAALSASSGIAAGFGALGGAGMLATASTGTAISSLSGVAATNATLAWFGGGSLAAGGLGMAGGTMILGGIVAGPVLAVAGGLFAAKAETAKNNAYANLEKAKAEKESMRSAQLLVRLIQRRVNEMFKILTFLNGYMLDYNKKFEEILKLANDYNKYSEEQKSFIKDYCNLAKTLKMVCDAPILDKDGKITIKSKEVLNYAREISEKLQEI